MSERLLLMFEQRTALAAALQEACELMRDAPVVLGRSLLKRSDLDAWAAKHAALIPPVSPQNDPEQA